MAKWNGTGIPPTRRKLHRYRLAKRLEREAALRAAKSEGQYRDHGWSKATKKSIVNPERFEELWT